MACVAPGASNPGQLSSTTMPGATYTIGFWLRRTGNHTGAPWTIGNGSDQYTQFYLFDGDMEFWNDFSLRQLYVLTTNTWYGFVVVCNAGALTVHVWQDGVGWIANDSAGTQAPSVIAGANELYSNGWSEQCSETCQVTHFFQFASALSQSEAEAALKTRSPAGSPVHLLRLDDHTVAGDNDGSAGNWTIARTLQTIASEPGDLLDSSGPAPLTIEPGALTLTSNDVGMTQSFLLPVDAGSIEATGSDVGMAHLTDFTLQVDPASLEIEGNEVDFLQNWAMSISPAILELRTRPVVMYHGLPDTGDYQWWPNETYVYWPDESYIPFPDD